MAATPTPNAAGRPCRCLRAKGMFLDAEPDPAVPNPRDGFYWCVHTMNCLGPDGKLATEDTCRPGRGCFQML